MGEVSPAKGGVSTVADASRPALVERLFIEQARALRAFFYRRVRSAAAAADLEQEVYLRMLRAVGTETIRNPEAYLFAVAGNLAKEHAAREHPRQQAVSVDHPGIQGLLAQLPDPAGEADTALRVGRLREVLRQLPPRVQAAVVLHYHHDLTYAQIAQRLGTSPHMIKKYLRQTMLHCRRRMARLG
jgi:RNA polymerase sigma-70 factor (ECF subfamily)